MQLIKKIITYINNNGDKLFNYIEVINDNEAKMMYKNYLLTKSKHSVDQLTKKGT